MAHFITLAEMLPMSKSILFYRNEILWKIRSVACVFYLAVCYENLLTAFKRNLMVQCIPHIALLVLPILPVSYLRLQLGLVIFYDKQVFSGANIHAPNGPCCLLGAIFTYRKKVQFFF